MKKADLSVRLTKPEIRSNGITCVANKPASSEWSNAMKEET